MFFTSTRNDRCTLQATEVILKGMAPDGGLFIPDRFPEVSFDVSLDKNYEETAFCILSIFLTGWKDLEHFVSRAYKEDRPVGIRHLHHRHSVLELFHGKSSAFKDVALQLLPYLLTYSLKSVGEQRKAVILTATSGDTGSSCMTGFANVPDTEVIVFYPHEGISQIQKLQMTTQEGNNVHAVAIKGNFDDAQSAVKEVFLDTDFAKEFEEQYLFTSANSINIGRLIPQVVYYFYCYAQLLKSRRIKRGERVNFTVPTGNFGNILAGYYAKKMGLPIHKLICATNRNSVLYDLFLTGEYNQNRDFSVTPSPSMDILVSSNFERLIYHFGGSALVIRCQKDLKEKGKYTVSIEMLEKMKETFYSAKIDDYETGAIIKEVYEKFGYILDPHSAVAFGAMEFYKEATQDDTYNIILATASPYKFPETVERAIGKPLEESGAPKHLRNLSNKSVLHGETVDKNEVRKVIRRILC
jgi:threonine synthase